MKSRILNLAEQQSKEVRREVNRLVALARDGAPAKTKLIGKFMQELDESLNVHSKLEHEWSALDSWMAGTSQNPVIVEL